jgi:dihydrofolate reductase
VPKLRVHNVAMSLDGYAANPATFHFVTGGIVALSRAFDAAGGWDVRLGGGVTTIKEYVRAGLVDEVHVAQVPLLLGAGERLFAGDAFAGYEVVEFVPSERVAHYRLERR